jgi:hypothetical protein
MCGWFRGYLKPLEYEMSAKHHCNLDFGQGPSFYHASYPSYCRSTRSGRFEIVISEEYSVLANFCPVCGAKAPRQSAPDPRE